MLSPHVRGVTRDELRCAGVPRRFRFQGEDFLVIGKDLFLTSITGNVCLRLRVTNALGETRTQSTNVSVLKDSLAARNARFWVWWHAGWVKLTLRPDQALTAGYGGPTEEGWSVYRESWFHAGNHILRECTSNSSDCDGRHSHYSDDACPLDQLAVRSHVRQTPWVEGLGCEFVADADAPLTPDWQEVQASQYDQFAEAAGY